jgi:hypothetical protein
VQDTLNLMRASRVDPTKSAYEILNGPYDWNRYPLAPLGCKAVIMKMEIREAHGRLGGSTDGIWVLPKTITGATYTSSQKREHTEYLGRPNCSLNIVNYQV